MLQPGPDGRHLDRRGVQHRRDVVVVQVAADARQVHARGDAVARELLGRPDPGQHEQPRGLQRPRAQDHLGGRLQDLRRAVARDLHAGAARTVEAQPERSRVREHGQVRVVEDRVHERHGRRVPATVADRELCRADAVELAAVVVVGVVRDARLQAGLLHRGEQRMRLVARRDVQRAADAVGLALAAVEVLGAPEQRQHVLVGPARAPVVRPAVVVEPVAADVDHPVHRARAAEHLPARPVDPAAVAGLLRLGVPGPVVLRERHLRPAARVVDRRVLVPAARLDERDGRTRVHQPPRDDRASRARADDDVVEPPRAGHAPRPCGAVQSWNGPRGMMCFGFSSSCVV